MTTADHRLVRFAELVSSMADQNEAMPASDRETAHQRNVGVRLLRKAAAEGAEAMWRLRSISPEHLDGLSIADRGRT